MNEAFFKISSINGWLDTSTRENYIHQPLAQDWARISKVAEELGEAIQAFISATGQNPRKPATGDINPVLDELADVALAALCAIQHFTRNAMSTQELFLAKIDFVYDRMGNV